MACRAFTLGGTGSAYTLEGIESVHVFPNKQSYLLLGEAETGVRIPLGDFPFGKIPEIADGKLRSALPVFGVNRSIIRLIEGESPKKLLRIKSHELSFGNYRKFDSNIVRHIWAGGEGAGVPFVQSGDRHGACQDQLFALDRNDKLIVIDNGAQHAAFVEARGTELYVREAGEDDLVEHVIRRAPFFRTVKECFWGLRLLLVAGKTSLADPLWERMGEISPGTRMDWEAVARS